MTAWLHFYALWALIGGLFCMSISCQKNLNAAAWIVFGLVLPFPGMVALAFSPGRN